MVLRSLDTWHRAAGAVRHSLGSLLVTGGDERIWLDPESGLDAYGCAPRVRDVVAFGSCTASSPTESGLDASRRDLERLRSIAATAGHEAMNTEAENMLEETRTRLMQVLELDQAGVRVAFCPSGTDAEYLALSLARGTSTAPIVNIISAPGEVGGGTTKAAAGTYFSPAVPAGGEHEVGTDVDTSLAVGVCIRTIAVRTA
ncbi:MAG: hypothetical protein KC431_21460, partial [Myxococcales bacterium]|nr:hypothetical protein [Myxococcales bacterium]